MLPAYDLDKLKYATDGPTFEKAVGLYGSGKVTRFQETLDGFSAVVLGSKPYSVFVEARHFDRGSCDCFVGQHDTVCKHMVAVAICAVMGGRPLGDEDKRVVGQVTCSGQLGELSAEKLAATKKAITAALGYIRPYRGPSRIWFGYQHSLSGGCNRLSALVGELPVSEQTAVLLVNLLLRLDRKLREGGVDDSDGTVGGFMEQVVGMLKEYARLDPACTRAFHALKNKDTSFGWEESLLDLIK
ncbi:MAG: hypothetical protein L0196_07060 [candidate division Zixibacteria bacterium]|nr:hypothetical protein [candidate division Zixibacteria bacterium]